MAAVLNNTTLATRMDRDDSRMKVAATTKIERGSFAVIDREVLLVTGVNTTAKIVEVQRGFAGTNSQHHANGSIVWADQSAFFIQPPPSGEAVDAEQPVYPRPSMPGKYAEVKFWHSLNGSWVEVPTEQVKDYRATDPRTSSEWTRVKASAAIATASRMVVIDGDGDAALTGASSVGRFGYNPNVQADDDYFWAQTRGLVTSPNTGADFMATTAALAEATQPGASGVVAIGASNQNIMFGFQVVTAAASGVAGVAYLSNPHTIGASISV